MKTVLCYGDSNTYGYNPENGMRFAEDVRWTGRLKSMLAGTCDVIEEGCNGRTTERDDPFEEWKNGYTFLKACLNSHKPIDLVLIMLGTNDLKTMFHASAEDIASGAEKLARETKSFLALKQGYEPEVLLISPILIGEGIASGPFAYSFDESAIPRSKEFAALYQAAAERVGCAFFDAATVADPSSIDFLHMDAENHAKLADGLHKEIAKTLSLE